MRLALTDLRVFLHACDSGSMTAAAGLSHLTLAAVSARIRALEDRAGVPLLRRHARGVAATAAGEALARHARVVLHQLAALERDLAAGPSREGGVTVLLANSSALARPLGPAVAAALAHRPEGRISVRESGSEVTVHALLRGAADLGIVSDAVATEGLEAEVLGPDPLVLATPRGHPLAAHGAAAFPQLLDQDWIAWGEGSALQALLAMQAGRAGGAIRWKAALPSSQDVLALVAAGAGISVLPAMLVNRCGLPVATAPIAEEWADRRLLLCRAPGLPGAAAAALAAGLRSLPALSGSSR